jgi:hypothetical protein
MVGNLLSLSIWVAAFKKFCFQKVFVAPAEPHSVNPLGCFVYMLDLSMVRLLLVYGPSAVGLAAADSRVLVLLLLTLGVFPPYMRGKAFVVWLRRFLGKLKKL